MGRRSMGLKLTDGDWFPVFRKIFKHRLWTDCGEVTGLMAWLWIIGKANHHDSIMLFRGDPIRIYRGQLATTFKSLAESWNWSRGRVARFLATLTMPADDPMIKLTWFSSAGFRPEVQEIGDVKCLENTSKTSSRVHKNGQWKEEKTDRSLLVISIVKYPEQFEKRAAETHSDEQQNAEKRAAVEQLSSTSNKGKKGNTIKEPRSDAPKTHPEGSAPRAPRSTKTLDPADPRMTKHQRNGILVRQKLSSGEFESGEVKAWEQEAEEEVKKRGIPQSARQMFVSSYIVKKGAGRLGLEV